MPDLICGKAAVGGNYNSTRDNLVLGTHPHVIEPIEWVTDEESEH